MISQQQMLDDVVSIPFKEYLKWLCSEWLMTENHALSPAGRIKMPSVMLLCQLIIMAWQGFSPEVTVKGLNAVYPVHWMVLTMIHCGMTVKKEE
jgi:hypothetical protein